MKKIPVSLQKMRCLNDGEIKTVVCAVNNAMRGGEFTFCGNAIPDSVMEYQDMEAVGEEYEGTCKDITCPNCRRIIDYVKSLK